MLSPHLLLLMKDLTLSQFMPPCDFCSLRGSLSKFSHLSLLLPPPLCNSTNSLNDRKDFLVGSFTNQVTCMGGVRPVISRITGKLSWLSMSGRTLITALVNKDRATQVIENTGPMKKLLWPLFLARVHGQEIFTNGRTESDKKLWDVKLLSFPYKLQLKMPGAVLSTSLKRLKDSPVYTS